MDGGPRIACSARPEARAAGGYFFSMARHFACVMPIAWCHANADRVQITAAGAIGPVFSAHGDNLYPS
ncbi:MAG: hypothetical protein Q7V13_12015 [Phenylobacterium sp.]|uniref:hypothetical protein n=1 Tax=Phenylobacterium sp. TaxID=1871053 RepID=UPI0027232287|nr:hypothetical protein [Phenylobacterium sp.]MDO8912568.1 hypothetical protein [Phenylobacterium sp.]